MIPHSTPVPIKNNGVHICFSDVSAFPENSCGTISSFTKALIVCFPNLLRQAVKKTPDTGALLHPVY